MLSQISVYITLIGFLGRVVWLIDPYEYFQEISANARDVLFWFSNMCVYAGAALAYTIWCEIVKNSKKVNVNFNFTIAKVVCFIMVALGPVTYFGVLLIVTTLNSYEFFDFVYVIVSVFYTFAFVVIHLSLLPMFSKVAKYSISQKIKDIPEYINWMILFTNGLTLFGGILRAMIEDPVFPLSSPGRIYVTLLFDWFFRSKELLMGYWFYKIVLYRERQTSSESKSSTRITKQTK
eukprot:TRINITY_DN12424_c0_g1_i1.p1 TRINITY_DN12424_c0_g1~~TRINITY_DN12424_c0_g1_i1.p1  ORF type:complete len:235 (-),score=28.46 TRINITY_DN12424_c0_g1_i1:9-713(-)